MNHRLSYQQRILLRRRTFLIVIPLFISLMIIVIVPTMVVLFSSGGGKDGQTMNTEKNLPVFQEIKQESDPIKVSVTRHQTGKIEKVPLEEYVALVVASEMPAEFNLEALKAQAIAARTYVVNHLLHDDDKLITDTTEHQVYRNKDELQQLWGSDFQWKWQKIRQAVNETKQMIITYNGKPITPTFFSMSNGYTEDAKYYWGNDFPYLKSVESKWEESLPNFTSQEIFTIEELKGKLNLSVSTLSEMTMNIKRTPSQRVGELTIGNESFTGREIREKLNLRSTDFTIKQQGNHFIFTTKGYGHGVGMSQYGANGMGEEGKTYEQILTYYYKDIEINEIKESASSLMAATNQ